MRLGKAIMNTNRGNHASPKGGGQAGSRPVWGCNNGIKGSPTKGVPVKCLDGDDEGSTKKQVKRALERLHEEPPQCR